MKKFLFSFLSFRNTPSTIRIAFFWLFIWLAPGLPAAPPTPASPTPLASLPGPSMAELPDEPTAECLQWVQAGQDAANRLDFDQAESLTAQAIALMPRHPMPHIFMLSVLVDRYQEEVLQAKQPGDPLWSRFETRSEQAISLAKDFEQARPNAYAKLYLAGILGTRGLLRLYRNDLFGSYADGSAAASDLRQALQENPQLINAYLGLGQYEYYCGRLAGLFQFLLNLHGDVNKGIEMLQSCSQRGSYAALPARICLAHILSSEQVNFEAGLPYVAEVYQRYPGNYAYAGYALREALGLGLDRPEARQLVEAVCAQWDQGWRPPQYAHFSLESARLKLAQTYQKLGMKKRAEYHFKMLSKPRQIPKTKC